MPVLAGKQGGAGRIMQHLDTRFLATGEIFDAVIQHFDSHNREDFGNPMPDGHGARRLKEPSTIIRDDPKYGDLRPGVMLSSGRFKDFSLLTTSEVLVQDSDG
jgi:hypothetical protein